MTWAQAAPVWTTIILAIIGAWFVLRHGGGSALEELERANGVLERRVKALEKENEELHAEVAVLRAKTDLAAAFAPVQEQLRTQHGEAMQLADRTLTLLGMIADRVGPEPA